MQFKFEPFPENTEAGRSFKSGWEDFVQRQHLPDVFWDPVQARWETYDRRTHTFARMSLPVVTLGDDYWTEQNILREVLNMGTATRVMDVAAIWDPRDGYWYHFTRVPATQPPLPPTPAPPVPDWMVRLNRDLAAVDANTNLTPEERRQARESLLQAALENAQRGA